MKVIPKMLSCIFRKAKELTDLSKRFAVGKVKFSQYGPPHANRIVEASQDDVEYRASRS